MQPTAAAAKKVRYDLRMSGLLIWEENLRLALKRARPRFGEPASGHLFAGRPALKCRLSIDSMTAVHAAVAGTSLIN
jgi:hypothetical protein